MQNSECRILNAERGNGRPDSGSDSGCRATVWRKGGSLWLHVAGLWLVSKREMTNDKWKMTNDKSESKARVQNRATDIRPLTPRPTGIPREPRRSINRPTDILAN